MKFDKQYNKEFLVELKETKILKHGMYLYCFICGAPTLWAENEFMKPICSDECLEKLWVQCPEKTERCD